MSHVALTKPGCNHILILYFFLPWLFVFRHGQTLCSLDSLHIKGLLLRRNLWSGPFHSFLLGSCHVVGAGRKSKALSIWHSHRRETAIHQQPQLIPVIWGCMALQNSGLEMATHCCCVLLAGCELCWAPPETSKQSGCMGLMEFRGSPCWYPSVCLQIPLIYFHSSILLGFICLGSGLKGHVVSLGLPSINTCLCSAEVQAVLFLCLFI